MAERRLTPTEQLLLDTIYDSFRASGVFPIYQWIDTELDAGGIVLAPFAFTRVLGELDSHPLDRLISPPAARCHPG